MSLRVCVIDNFDSFTYNLVEYLSEQHIDGEPVTVEVFKNTASVNKIEAYSPDALVISPGPGHPKNNRDVGVTNELLQTVSTRTPTLGVCLGLEAAVHVYGGKVGHAPAPIHGKSSSITHDREGIFTELDNPFEAGRYHSLIATEIPDCFDISATAVDSLGDTPTELVMGIRHCEHPIEAVQFHPESVLTGVGHDLISNFLSSVAADRRSDR
ncbi:MAG: glutamine amidotransferase of anthranilate synthase or aminodeoxychorismate synthase [Haloquadratum sp. J07HQX50]|nr:MAG: glutamine amidotransferase of anthranilate synthase or aminodeoxychorismate synthase [Haloquadratum sp. J07HQX50]